MTKSTVRTGFIILLIVWGIGQGFASEPVSPPRFGKTAQTRFPFSKKNNDPVMEVDSVSCTLPFSITGGLILVKARVDSVEGNFVFDTGAPYMVLNKTYFRNVERIYNHDETQSGINGENGLAEKAMVNAMHFGTFRYYKVESDLLNLGHLENARGVKILGLLGVALFKQCEVMIDYQNRLIHLRYIHRKEQKLYRHASLSQPEGYDEHSFELLDNRIILQARMGKKKLKFVVDYAAEANILDSRLPASVIDSVRVNSRITIYGTGTTKVDAVKGDLPGFTFGNTTYDLPVVVTNLENSCFAPHLCINGVLGFNFLSRSRLIFNFVTRKLYVLK